MKNVLTIILMILLNQIVFAQTTKINYNTRVGAIFNAPYFESSAGLQNENLVIPSFQGKLGWSLGFSASKQLKETSNWLLGVDFDFMRKSYQLESNNFPPLMGPTYQQDFVVIRPTLGYSFTENLGIDFGPYMQRSIGKKKQENAPVNFDPAFNENENVDYGASLGLNVMLKPINIKLILQQGLNVSKYIEITDDLGNQVGSISSYNRTYQFQVGYNF